MSGSSAGLLLIDANPDDAKLIRDELEQASHHDYTLAVASSLGEGISRLKKGGIQAILLDMILPDSQGISSFLRLYARAESLPIIVLVDQADEDLGELAVRKGALDSLIKQQLVSHLLIKALRYATERTHTLMALKASEAKYRDLFQNVAAGVFQTSPDGRFLSANPAMARLLGYDNEDELLGLDISDEVYMYPDARSNWVRTINEQGEIRNAELVLRKKDGTKIVVLENARAIRDSHGNIQYYQGTLNDITEAHEHSKQLSYDASHDALTGLVNRREFENRVDKALQEMKASKSQHAMCYLDLDKFKVINDNCGHVAGDELLRQLGAVLHARIRQGDTIARLGGDEFGVLLNHCTPENATLVAKNLLRTIGEFQFAWEQRHFQVGASIGLVPIDSHFKNVTDVLSAADTACYTAKERGRNRLHLYERGERTQAAYAGGIQWASRVKKALENDEYQLDFQPIVPLASTPSPKRYVEALIRLKGEDGKQYPPGAFLPTLERYNLMQHLDRWVLKNTVEQLSAQTEILASLGRVFINLSKDSLQDEHFPQVLLEILRNGRVRPQTLCFEITESAAMANLTKANQTITAVRQMGCRMALDDFGTGVSSFAYLKALQVDYLKIDGAHLRDIDEDSSNLQIVRAITDVGHALGREVIAESVENRGVLKTLKKIGVDYAQGYSIAPPRPIGDLADLRTTIDTQTLKAL